MLAFNSPATPFARRPHPSLPAGDRYQGFDVPNLPQMPAPSVGVAPAAPTQQLPQVPYQQTPQVLANNAAANTKIQSAAQRQLEGQQAHATAAHADWNANGGMPGKPVTNGIEMTDEAAREIFRTSRSAADFHRKVAKYGVNGPELLHKWLQEGNAGVQTDFAQRNPNGTPQMLPATPTRDMTLSGAANAMNGTSLPQTPATGRGGVYTMPNGSERVINDNGRQVGDAIGQAAPLPGTPVMGPAQGYTPIAQDQSRNQTATLPGAPATMRTPITPQQQESNTFADYDRGARIGEMQNDADINQQQRILPIQREQAITQAIQTPYDPKVEAEKARGQTQQEVAGDKNKTAKEIAADRNASNEKIAKDKANPKAPTEQAKYYRENLHSAIDNLKRVSQPNYTAAAGERDKAYQLVEQALAEYKHFASSDAATSAAPASPSTQPAGKGKPTLDVAHQYVAKFGLEQARKKLAEEGYDMSGGYAN